MTTIARMAVLDLRTVASHRKQSLIVFAAFAVVAGLLAAQPISRNVRRGEKAISTGDSSMPAAVTSRAVRRPH